MAIANEVGIHATMSFSVEGMHCASCVAKVERSLKSLPDVIDARVSLVTERATVDTSTGPPAFAELARAVEQAGFKAIAPETPPATATASALRPRGPAASDREALARVILAVALGAPLMLLAMVPALASPRRAGSSARSPAWSRSWRAGRSSAEPCAERAARRPTWIR